MASFMMLIALFANTMVNTMIGGYWYSLQGLGNLWIKLFLIWSSAYFGGMPQFEVARVQNKRTMSALMGTTALCNLCYNVLLLFLIHTIYAPHTMGDLFMLAAAVTAIYVLLDLPHVGFENRSYTAVLVHASYHFVCSLVSLFIYKQVFKFPKSYIRF